MTQISPARGPAGCPPSAPEVAVGVDGYRSGWVLARLCGAAVSWSVAPEFGDVLAAHPDATIGVDMPIGFPSAGTRPCDRLARAYLGAARSSVFLTPPRAVVERCEPGASHAETSRYAREAFGRGLPIQTWHILRRARELDAALDAWPVATAVEVHPECSFRAMAPGVPFASKRSPLGASQRLAALRERFELPDRDATPGGVPLPDLLDAVAAAWSADRYRRGVAIVWPDDAVRDDHGRPMRIIV